MKEKINQAFSLERNEFLDILEPIEATKNNYQSLTPFSVEEKDALQSYDEAFVVRFAYNSSAIEGSTLSIIDAELILEGEFVPGKPGREQFMVRGVAEGFDFAKQAIEEEWPFNEDLIKDIHQCTALDNQPRTRGVYRTSAVYLANSEVVPASPLQVREYMADLMYAYENSKMHPLLKVAAFHAMFENIHPFQDGNGRTGRTIMNYMLMQQSYPPVALKADNRKGYIESLAKWQIHGDAEELVGLLCESLKNEIDERTKAVEITRQATAEDQELSER